MMNGWDRIVVFCLALYAFALPIVRISLDQGLTLLQPIWLLALATTVYCAMIVFKDD